MLLERKRGRQQERATSRERKSEKERMKRKKSDRASARDREREGKGRESEKENARTCLSLFPRTEGKDSVLCFRSVLQIVVTISCFVRNARAGDARSD